MAKADPGTFEAQLQDGTVASHQCGCSKSENLPGHHGENDADGFVVTKDFVAELSHFSSDQCAVLYLLF
jgi:hypothetical protein